MRHALQDAIKSGRAAVVVAACAGASGCWPGWDAFFAPDVDAAPHQITALRVLAVVVEPPVVRIPQAVVSGGGVVSLDVAVHLAHPAGGSLTVTLAACQAAEGEDCARGSAAFPAHTTTLRPPPPADRLGAVTVPHTVDLDATALAGLAADAGLSFPSFARSDLVLTVAVSPEQGPGEIARLRVPLRLDPFDQAWDLDARDALAAAVDTTVCQGPLDARCTGDPPPSVCGNGVIDLGESCDPSDGVTCDPNCRTLTSCFGSPPPSCLPEFYAENQRPRVLGLVLVDNATDVAPFVDPGRVDVAPGAALVLPVSGRLGVVPVVNAPDARFEPFLPDLPQAEGCPPLRILNCGIRERHDVRVLITRGAVDVVEPRVDGVYQEREAELDTGVVLGVEGGGAGGDAFVVVVADGRGGMDVAVFPIVSAAP